METRLREHVPSSKRAHLTHYGSTRILPNQRNTSTTQPTWQHRQSSFIGRKRTHPFRKRQTATKGMVPTAPNQRFTAGKEQIIRPQMPQTSIGFESLAPCMQPMYKRSVTKLGWATVWKTAFEENNRRRTEATNRLQANQGGNNTDGQQQETTNNNSNNQQQNSNSKNNNNNVTRYSAPAYKIQLAALPTIPIDNTQTKQAERPQPLSLPKRKWTHFPPKPPKATDVAKAEYLPIPTPEEENYLQNTTQCWDVVARTINIDQQHMIPDSGCRHHITHNKSDFINLHNFDTHNIPYVKMADDQTHSPISGYGTIQLQIRDKQVHLAALYVPTMKTHLFAVSQHIQYLPRSQQQSAYHIPTLHH